MNKKFLGKYYIFSSIGIMTASSYPIYMGIRVVGVLLILLVSGCITALICKVVNRY